MTGSGSLISGVLPAVGAGPSSGADELLEDAVLGGAVVVELLEVLCWVASDVSPSPQAVRVNALTALMVTMIFAQRHEDSSCKGRQ